MTYFSRRTFLRAMGVAAVGASAVSTPAAAHEAPMTRPILCEVDMDGKFDIENHRTDDPTVEWCEDVDDSTRESVLHVTSNGHQTKDYSSGIVNLEDQINNNLKLGRVTSEGVFVGFDYLQGPENANAAPDEVFLIVREGDASSDAEGLHAVYKTINDGDEPSSETGVCDNGWRGLDVSDEMTGDGIGDRDWAEISITKDDVTNGEMVIQTARSLRDQEDRFENVVRRFGANAELVAVGYGKGFTTQKTVSDVYYDELVVRRGRGNQVNRDTFPFPATVPMDVTFEGHHSGTLTATLTPQQQQVGLDLSDVIEDSVKLTPYIPVTPPVEDGVSASSVSVSEGEIVAEFSESEAAKDEPVLVSGWFDNEAGDAFVAQASSVKDKSGHNSSALHL